MSQRITLYDIPSKKEPQAWSSNTWKARFVLNFKKIPYQTTWVEFPDIKGVCEEVGIPPTGKEADGSPRYTLPAIFDSSTKTALSESIVIAQYLDKTYPDTPKVIPNGTLPLQLAFADTFRDVMKPIFPFAIAAVYKILNSRSEEYYGRTREKIFGKSMETLAPVGAARDEEWTKVKESFDQVHRWLEHGKNDGPWTLGEELSFVDFVMGSWLVCLREAFGESSLEWKDITSWNEGQWGAFAESLKEYETVL